MAYTTINKSTEHFNTKLYTGNGSARTITTGMQPDLNWIKRRNQVDNHWWTDSVRGATKYIGSNRTNAEATETTAVTGITSTGFTLGADTNQGEVNANTYTYCSWNWKANGAGSANTDGSISSTVSANTTSGFSIVSYTGTGSAGTVGHGLGSTPKMIIFKDRSNVNGWHTYHSSFANATDLLLLDTTNALYTANNYINNTRPTSSVFSLGNTAGTNGSSANYIAYCFAEKQGYSKFGSYVGTGRADNMGPHIYTGMKPSFVMIKRASGTGGWFMFDNKRDTFNLTSRSLQADTSGAENNYTADDTMNLDILSNGFKLKSTDGAVNSSGSTYIYMTFAEAPIVGSNNVPCTAR